MAKMTVGIATVLKTIVDKILFTTNEDGVVVEAKIPFAVRYRLQRARTLLEREYIYVLRKRVELLKEMGITTPDLTEEQVKELTEKLAPITSKEVEHEFIKLRPEEIKDIPVDNITAEETDVFSFYMVEDEALDNELKVELD